MTTTQAPIALITGASRGLGKSAALHAAQQGNDIIVTYHSQQSQAQAVVDEIKAMGRQAVSLQLDCAHVSSFGEFANTLGQTLQAHWSRDQFDALVNNAGTGIHASLMDTTEAQFDDMVNVHLKGVFFLTQKLLPMLANGGRIVNVSSGLTRFSVPGYAAYAAMKGGVEVLTRFMAKELGPRGITANTLAPGAIATDFGNGAVRDNAELNAYITSQTALGRVGVPDDIGAAVSAMLSPSHRWVNAQRIEASGGMFI